MKKVLAIVMSLLLLSIFTLPSYAHSGRTDSSGGHRNSVTGNYHYHCGGHPAHEHIFGVCPYDIKDSNNSGKNNENTKGIVIASILLPIIAIILIATIRDQVRKKRHSPAKTNNYESTTSVDTIDIVVIIKNCSVILEEYTSTNSFIASYKDQLLQRIRTILENKKELLNTENTDRLSLSLVCASVSKLISSTSREDAEDIYHLYENLLDRAFAKGYIDEARKQELLQSIIK